MIEVRRVSGMGAMTWWRSTSQHPGLGATVKCGSATHDHDSTGAHWSVHTCYNLAIRLAKCVHAGQDVQQRIFAGPHCVTQKPQCDSIRCARFYAVVQ